MYDYLRLIVCENAPLCVVERESSQRISKHVHTFSSKWVKIITFQVVEFIEVWIGNEICELVHDAWANAGVRYDAIQP